MTETRSSRPRQRADSACGSELRGGFSGFLSALAEGYVELVSESARFAGNIVGDLSEECSAPIRGRLRDDPTVDRTSEPGGRTRGPALDVRTRTDRQGQSVEGEGVEGAVKVKDDARDEDCGCLVTDASIAGDCVDVVDRAYSRFRDTWDSTRPRDRRQTTVQVKDGDKEAKFTVDVPAIPAEVAAKKPVEGPGHSKT